MAAQAACVPLTGGVRPPLSENAAFAPFIRFRDGVHVSFFTPFFDPLSPGATWYSIDTHIVRDAELEHERDTASATQALERMAGALGLGLHDPQHTLGTVVAPIYPRSTLGGPPFDTRSGLSPGAPAVYVDGMLAIATGSLALRDALRLQGDLARAVSSALRGLRFRNWLMQQVMTNVPLGCTRWLARWAPGLLRSLLAIDWRP